MDGRKYLDRIFRFEHIRPHLHLYSLLELLYLIRLLLRLNIYSNTRAVVDGVFEQFIDCLQRLHSLEIFTLDKRFFTPPHPNPFSSLIR